MGVLQAWTGDIDSASEFELTRCACGNVSGNGRFCLDWTCEERGMAYHYPNPYWVFLHSSLAIIFLSGWWLLVTWEDEDDPGDKPRRAQRWPEASDGVLRGAWLVGGHSVRA